MSFVILATFLTIYGIASILFSKAFKQLDFELFGLESDNIDKTFILNKDEILALNKYDDGKECLVCFDAIPDIKFLQCKHHVICGHCYGRLSFFDKYHCILCRKNIEGVITIGKEEAKMIVYKKNIVEIDYEYLLF